MRRRAAGGRKPRSGDEGSAAALLGALAGVFLARRLASLEAAPLSGGARLRGRRGARRPAVWLGAHRESSWLPGLQARASFRGVDLAPSPKNAEAHDA